MARTLKSWDLTISGKQYHIELKPKAVVINDTAYDLKQLPYVRKCLLFSEYRLPIEGADVRISCELTQQLVVDNKIFGTDQQYMPLDKFPPWAYVFAALHLGNFLGGAIGGVLVVLGAALTLSVARRPDLNTAVKLLFSVLILIAAYTAMYFVGLLVGGLL